MMALYNGNTTATLLPSSAKAAGNDPITSAKPPLLMNGKASPVTNNIFFILNSVSSPDVDYLVFGSADITLVFNSGMLVNYDIFQM